MGADEWQGLVPKTFLAISGVWTLSNAIRRKILKNFKQEGATAGSQKAVEGPPWSQSGVMGRLGREGLKSPPPTQESPGAGKGHPEQVVILRVPKGVLPLARGLIITFLPSGQ